MATEFPLLNPENPVRAQYHWQGVGNFSVTCHPDPNVPMTEVQISLEGEEPISLLLPLKELPDMLKPTQESEFEKVLNVNEEVQTDPTTGFTFITELYKLINTSLMDSIKTSRPDDKNLPSLINHTLNSTTYDFTRWLINEPEVTQGYFHKPEVVKANVIKMNNLYRAVEAIASGKSITLEQMFRWINEFGTVTAITTARAEDTENTNSRIPNCFEMELLGIDDILKLNINPEDYFHFIEIITNAFKDHVGANKVKIVVEHEEEMPGTIAIHIGDNGKGFSKETVLNQFEEGVTGEPGTGHGQGLHDLLKRTDLENRQPQISIQLESADTESGERFIVSSDPAKVTIPIHSTRKFAVGPAVRPDGKNILKDSPAKVGDQGSVLTVFLNYWETLDYLSRIEMEVNETLPMPESWGDITISKGKNDLDFHITITKGTEKTELSIPAVYFDPIGDKGIRASDISHAIEVFFTKTPGRTIFRHAIGSYLSFGSFLEQVPGLIQDNLESKTNKNDGFIEFCIENALINLNIAFPLLKGFEYIDNTQIPIKLAIQLLEEFGRNNTLKNIDIIKTFTSNINDLDPLRGIDPYIWLNLIELIRNAEKDPIEAQNIRFTVITNKQLSVQKSDTAETKLNLIENQEMVTFAVSDDGVGFDLDKINEFFKKGLSQTGSTGLGLHILKEDPNVKDLTVITWKNGEAIIFHPQTENKGKEISIEELHSLALPYIDPNKPIGEHGSLIIFSTPAIPNEPKETPSQ